MPATFRHCPSARKVRRVKRTEVRAPAQILLEALNPCAQSMISLGLSVEPGSQVLAYLARILHGGPGFDRK
jgi:hypothetical protein